MWFVKSTIMILPHTIFKFRKQLQMVITSMGCTNSIVDWLILILRLVGLEIVRLLVTYLLDMELAIQTQE